MRAFRKTYGLARSERASSALVDAYALAEAAGLGDPGDFAVARRAAAERVGRWSGSALELWISLCMEQLWDRWQSGGAIGMNLTAPPLPMAGQPCRNVRAEACGAGLAGPRW